LAASEIAAAARSLKTNLILSLVFIIGFYFLASFSEILTVVIVSAMKGLVPILTTIANFGKIQHVLALYGQRIYFTLTDCFKCSM
jgi:hypothetical protein